METATIELPNDISLSREKYIEISLSKSSADPIRASEWDLKQNIKMFLNLAQQSILFESLKIHSKLISYFIVIQSEAFQRFIEAVEKKAPCPSIKIDGQTFQLSFKSVPPSPDPTNRCLVFHDILSKWFQLESTSTVLHSDHFLYKFMQQFDSINSIELTETPENQTLSKDLYVKFASPSGLSRAMTYLLPLDGSCWLVRRVGARAVFPLRGKEDTSDFMSEARFNKRRSQEKTILSLRTQVRGEFSECLSRLRVCGSSLIDLREREAKRLGFKINDDDDDDDTGEREYNTELRAKWEELRREVCERESFLIDYLHIPPPSPSSSSSSPSLSSDLHSSSSSSSSQHVDEFYSLFLEELAEMEGNEKRNEKGNEKGRKGERKGNRGGRGGGGEGDGKEREIRGKNRSGILGLEGAVDRVCSETRRARRRVEGGVDSLIQSLSHLTRLETEKEKEQEKIKELNHVISLINHGRSLLSSSLSSSQSFLSSLSSLDSESQFIGELLMRKEGLLRASLSSVLDKLPLDHLPHPFPLLPLSSPLSSLPSIYNFLHSSSSSSSSSSSASPSSSTPNLTFSTSISSSYFLTRFPLVLSRSVDQLKNLIEEKGTRKEGEKETEKEKQKRIQKELLAWGEVRREVMDVESFLPETLRKQIRDTEEKRGKEEEEEEEEKRGKEEEEKEEEEKEEKNEKVEEGVLEGELNHLPLPLPSLLSCFSLLRLAILSQIERRIKDIRNRVEREERGEGEEEGQEEDEEENQGGVFVHTSSSSLMTLRSLSRSLSSLHSLSSLLSSLSFDLSDRSLSDSIEKKNNNDDLYLPSLPSYPSLLSLLSSYKERIQSQLTQAEDKLSTHSMEGTEREREEGNAEKKLSEWMNRLQNSLSQSSTSSFHSLLSSQSELSFFRSLEQVLQALFLSLSQCRSLLRVEKEGIERRLRAELEEKINREQEKKRKIVELGERIKILRQENAERDREREPLLDVDHHHHHHSPPPRLDEEENKRPRRREREREKEREGDEGANEGRVDVGGRCFVLVRPVWDTT